MNFFGIMLTKRLRQSEGKTKYRLAKDSGVSEPSVVSITNGKLRPSDRALIAFASVEWLGVDLQTLMAWRAIDEEGQDTILKACQELVSMDPSLHERFMAYMQKKETVGDG